MRNLKSLARVIPAALLIAGCVGAQEDDSILENKADTSPTVDEAQTATSGRGCGTPDLDVATRDAIESDLARYAFAPRPFTVGTVIPTYVHVIRDSSGNGGPTTQQMNNQLAVLNAAYASTGNCTSTGAAAGSSHCISALSAGSSIAVQPAVPRPPSPPMCRNTHDPRRGTAGAALYCTTTPQ